MKHYRQVVSPQLRQQALDWILAAAQRPDPALEPEFDIADDERREVVGTDSGEGAAVAADRGTDPSDEVGLWHADLLTSSSWCGPGAAGRELLTDRKVIMAQAHGRPRSRTRSQTLRSTPFVSFTSETPMSEMIDATAM